jgi:hypothetical protein
LIKRAGKELSATTYDDIDNKSSNSNKANDKDDFALSPMSVYHSAPPSPQSLSPPNRSPEAKVMEIAHHGMQGPRAPEAREYGPYGHLTHRSSPIGGTNYKDEQKSASSTSTKIGQSTTSRKKYDDTTIVNITERELDDDMVCREREVGWGERDLKGCK